MVRDLNFRGTRGFTLMELLLVIGVMAILATIIMGSANYVTRLGRVRRAETTRRVLEAALYRYRSDHNKWPASESLKKTKTTTFSGRDNYTIFKPLLDSTGIQYLDPTTLFTVDDRNRFVRLSTTKGPLVYATRNGGEVAYFRVVIDVDADTVKVTTPDLEDDDDEDYESEEND